MKSQVLAWRIAPYPSIEGTPISQHPTINDFEQLLRRLAEVVFRKIEAELGGRKWQCATLDVRYNRQGTSWLSKIRVVTSGGVVMSLQMSNDIDLLLISLNTMRGIQEDEWYDLKLEVDRTQRCETTFNYDPNCCNDQSFYET